MNPKLLYQSLISKHVVKVWYMFNKTFLAFDIQVWILDDSVVAQIVYLSISLQVSGLSRESTVVKNDG